jgi:hypothetical protein
MTKPGYPHSDETDDEVIADMEKQVADGTLLEGWQPIKAKPSRKRSMMFAVRLSDSELKEFTNAAKVRGVTVADLMRSATHAAIIGDLDASRAKSLGAALEHADELVKLLEPLAASTRKQTSKTR